MIKKIFVFIAILMLPVTAGATILAPSGVSRGDVVGSDYYDAYIATPPGSGGVVATDGWTDGFMFQWLIKEPGTGAGQSGGNFWLYTYRISSIEGENLAKGLSHFILGISESIDSLDSFIWDISFTAYTPEGSYVFDEDYVFLGDYYDNGSSSNPYMPTDPTDSSTWLHGIKFEFAEDTPDVQQAEFVFKSTQNPVWDNGYAKDGKDQQQEWAAAWNTGFNPEIAIDKGYIDENTELRYIAAPDTESVIPEPGTLLLLGSGLVGLAGYGKLRFRRKRK